MSHWQQSYSVFARSNRAYWKRPNSHWTETWAGFCGDSGKDGHDDEPGRSDIVREDVHQDGHDGEKRPDGEAGFSS